MQAHRFRKAKHQVHVLKSRTGLALHQVVDMSYDSEAFNARIYADDEIAEIGAAHVERADGGGATVDADERAVLEEVTVESHGIGLRQRARQVAVKRGENAAADRTWQCSD